MLKTLLTRASGVAVGTAAGQGLVLLATPYLARIYPRVDFGLLALLMTISNISMAAACLRYDLALPSAPRSDARGLLATALIVATTLGVLTAFGVALIARHDWMRIGETLLRQPFMVASCVVFSGLFQATCAWLLHRGAFAAVAWFRFSQGAMFSVLALFPAVGLGWAHVFSFLGGLWAVKLLLDPRLASDAGWEDVARRYRQFPLVNLPGALLDVCGYSLCIWVITAFYGEAVAGNYSQVQRIIGAGLMLLSMSLGQVLLKQTAEHGSDRAALRRFFQQLIGLLLGIAVVALIVVWLVGEPFMLWLLGPNWKVDRPFLTLVAVAVFVRACVSPLSTVLVTLRRLEIGLLWQALYFCSALSLMPFVAARVAFPRFVLFYAIHELVFYSLYLGLIFRALGDRRALPAAVETSL